MLVYVVATAADGVGADPVAPAVGAAGSLLGAVLVVVELQRRDLGVVAGYLALVLVGTGVVIGAAVAWGWAVGVATGGAIAAAMVVELGREPNLRRPRPGLTPQWQLRRAATNRWATVASLQTLDPSVAGLSRTGRAGRTGGPPPGHLRRLPWAPGLAAVVALRNLRTGAVPALVSMLGGLVVHQVWATTAALVVVLTLETVVTIWLARPLEAWRTTPSVRRTWTPPRSGAALALALPSLLVSWAVAVAAALVIRPTWPALVVMAVLPAAVLWRRSRAGRSDLGDVLLATPLGPVPVDLLDRVAAGPDVLVIAVITLSVVS